MRFVNPLVALVLGATVQSGIAAVRPCVAAEETILINLPGYDNEIGLKGATGKQALLNKAVSKCMRKFNICLLTDSGSVVRGDSRARVVVKEKKVLFGLDQTMAINGRQHCVTGTLVGPSEGMAAWWAYRTFTASGSWVGEEIPDTSSDLKTSAELFERLSEDFKAFLERSRQ